ncbi:MAG TPA: AmmeMemoRadiSam system protein A, partial [Labilithrix sp.]
SLGGARAERPSASWCDDRGASFVTLRWKDDSSLQGCIGSLEPRRALVDDVGENAVAAATLDPRSDPIALADVDALDVEISELSPLEPTTASDIQPGVHGVVFDWGERRATLLPSMWDRLPTVAEFMAALEKKARFPTGRSRDDVRLLRYTVKKYVAS